MKVGDIVRHRNYPGLTAVVLEFGEDTVSYGKVITATVWCEETREAKCFLRRSLEVVSRGGQ